MATDDRRIRITDSDDRNMFPAASSSSSGVSQENESYIKAQRMIHVAIPTKIYWSNRQDVIVERNKKLNLFIFASDNPESSTRNSKMYTLSSLSKMHAYMERRSPRCRNIYEVMRIGVPSKLYVDVDVAQKQCPDFNFARFDLQFEKDMRAFLSEEVHADFADNKITPLLRYDSSNESKWSRHYLFNGAMFLNNFHVGAIMRRFRSYILKKYGNPDDITSNTLENIYFIPPRDAHIIIDGYRKEYIVDMTVYTRLRVFRLPGNRKYTGTTTLVPVGEGFDLEKSMELQKEYFPTLPQLQEGIVQDPVLALRCKIHSVVEEDGTYPGSYSVHRKQARNAIGTSVGVQAYRNLQTSSSGEQTTVTNAAGLRSITITDPNLIFNTSELTDMRDSSSYIPCDPKLASFLSNMIHENKYVLCSTRSARYYPDSFTVNLNVGRTKACFMKEGDHSAVKTHFLIYLMSKEFSQHCFSARCRAKAEEKNPNSPDWPTWPIPEKYHAEIDRFLESSSSTRMSGIIDIGKIYNNYIEKQNTIRNIDQWNTIVSQTKEDSVVTWESMECSESDSVSEEESDSVMND